MIRSMIEGTGPFFLPQIALQVITLGLVVAYFIALKRDEISAGVMPWEKTLGTMSAIATSVGLFGTVVGFIGAFGAFKGAIDVAKVSEGLAVAFYTTYLGMITSLVALIGGAILSAVGKERT